MRKPHFSHRTVLALFVALLLLGLTAPGAARAAVGAGNAGSVTDLRSTLQTRERVVLTWTPTNGAANYRIRRNGQVIATQTSNWYTDLARSAGTTYSYTVAALNNAGTASTGNNTISVTTQGGPVASTADPVTDLRSTRQTRERVVLNWTKTPGAVDYRISRNGQVIGTQTGNWFTDLGRSPGTTYSYTVAAVDPLNVPTTGNNTISVTTQGGVAAGPSPVTDLRSTRQTKERVVLTWTPTAGATNYRISRDGQAVATQTGNWYTDLNRTAGTEYRYTVAALNNAGTASTGNNAINVTTEGGNPGGPGPATYPINLVALGDIADCRGEEASVGQLVATLEGDILALGDIAYPDGSAANFADCFDPHFGPVKDRILPVAGNHEYYTPNATPYFEYFGAAAGDPDEGWYSIDRGNWQIIVLNTNCGKVGGCHRASSQYQWLKTQLEARPTACRLVAMHHPRWSSYSPYADQANLSDFYELMYDHKTDLLLVGHVHGYERFHPLNPSGEVDYGRGIRQIIVGTGGTGLRPLNAPVIGSRVRNTDTWGVLDLNLWENGYNFSFERATGGNLADSGSYSCLN